jgi:RHS repeat-associated protein
MLSNFHFFRSLSLSVSAVLLFACVARGQVLNVTDVTSTPIPGAGHDYIKMLGETVNPADGAVSIRVGTPVPPGRKLTLPFAFAYDSNGAHYPASISNLQIMWFSNTSILSNGGWGYSVPMLSAAYETRSFTTPYTGPTYSCNWYTDFVFQDPSGGRHALGLASISYDYSSGGVGSSGCTYFGIATVANGGDPLFLAVSGTQGGPSTYGTAPYLISDADGTLYHFPTYPHDLGSNQTFQELPDFVADRNGNEITYTDSGGGAFTALDTLGRTVVSSSGFGTTGNTVSIAGLSNPYTISWGSASYNYSVGASIVPGTSSHCSLIPALSGSQPVISSITLPNGTSYHLYYDSTYGLLNKVVYPTGGYIRYVWGMNAQSEVGSFTDTYGNPGACFEYYGTPVVLHRYVSFNGSTEVLQQDFTYSTQWNGAGWTSKKTIVKTSDLTPHGGSFQTTYSYSSVPAPYVPDEAGQFAAQIPVEQTVTYGDWNGSTARTVNKRWLDQYRLACQQTVLGSSSPYSMELFYYAPGAQLAEKDEYDFGTSCPSSNPQTAPTTSLLRKTAITYHSFVNTPLFTSTYYTGGAPIYDRPDSVTICRPSGTGPACPGSSWGVQVSQTNYGYDAGSLAPSNVQTGRDSDYTTSMNVRGNATSNSVWVNTTGSPLVWGYTYDDTGQQVSMTDPKGNLTTYSYTPDEFLACGPAPGSTNAYLTKITDAKGFTQSFTYRYCDGQLNSATDRNNQTTSYSYVDSLARLTQISYPDTGTITYTYNDGSPTSSIVTTRTMDSSGTTNIATQVFDAAGHVTRSQLNTDPVDCSGGADNTDTTYDGLGRAWKVSNPYCSGSPDPNSTGTTYYTYDALGRLSDEATKSIVYPDGSATSTTYSGSTSTIIDPAGKTRILGYDALGHLSAVTEDPGAAPHLNYSTTYTYNALDDLLTVTQGSQTRTFAYDSLSRLTSATNPESGTANYTYSVPGTVCSGDPSSVCTRTDARGITTYYDQHPNGSPCPYDALNRLVCKSYSDGTPAAQFFYDESSATLGSWASGSLAHPNGRLTHTITVNSSGTILTGTAQDYDQMGRVADFYQYFPTGCGNNPVCSSNYHYEYTGEVNQWTHPAGYTLTNTISPARRITEISSSLNDATHPPALAQSITYTAWGALSTLVNGAPGGGTGAQETYQYNNRLQPVMIELGTTGNHTADYCLVYNYYSGAWNPLSCTTPSQGTTNNGNVMGYWYQDYVNPSSFSHKASYTYDGVNRLSTATAKTLAGSTIWSQTYSYDQWGNGSCSGTGLCPSLTYNSQHNNRLATIGNYSFSYDAAGNLTYDPSNLSAHTYQWDAEGRVASVDSGSTWSFTYNALGHRVQWASPSGGELHLFDPEGNWLGNANSYTLVRFGERPLALYEGSQTYFNHVNALGSTSMFTNQTGGPQEDMLFYPWGDVWKSQGTGGYNFAYLPYRDLSTTTDITTARFISPNFGRWLSPDPLGGQLIDPQTLNKYAYVRNNPTTLTDPLGLYVCADDPLCKSKQDVAFENARQADLLSKNADVVRGAQSYGDPTKDNGVNVSFADLSRKGEGGETLSTLGTDASGSLRANSNVVINSNLSGTQLDAAVGHEGSHVADAQDVVNSIIDKGSSFTVGQNITWYSSEQRAYSVTDSILRSGNQTGHFYCGVDDCTLGIGLKLTGQIPGVVDQILAHGPTYKVKSNGQQLSSTNQGGSVVNGLVVPH